MADSGVDQEKARTLMAKNKVLQKWLGGGFKLSGGKTQNGKDTQDEPIIEVQRRFQFDDTALRRGLSVKELFIAEEPPEQDFNDVVDMDDERMEDFVAKELVGTMIESFAFKMFIMALIVVNSVLIALQTDQQLSIDNAFYFSIFDQLVLTIFVCEILLKWYHGFFVFWKTSWNWLDFFLVLALLLGPTLTFLSSSRILRILRVLRAFRSLRSVSALAGLSLVVQTILQSIPDMLNICLLLCIILMMFSVAGVMLFGKDVPDHFGDLGSAMFSLFICVTQDGWLSILGEFKVHGSSIYYGGAVYFSVSIMVGAFVFANLVVAVVVTNLELAMKEFREESKALEDTLVSGTTSSTDDHHLEGHEEVPLVSADDAHHKVDITNQHPLQLSDMSNLTCEKLEHYILLIVAAEQNLVEYQKIRDKLDELFDTVCSLNTKEEAASETDVTHNTDMNFSNFGKKGDILSNLMSIPEPSGASGGLTMQGFIKETVAAVTGTQPGVRRTSTVPGPARFRSGRRGSKTETQDSSDTLEDDDECKGQK